MGRKTGKKKSSSVCPVKSTNLAKRKQTEATDDLRVGDNQSQGASKLTKIKKCLLFLLPERILLLRKGKYSSIMKKITALRKFVARQLTHQMET